MTNAHEEPIDRLTDDDVATLFEIDELDRVIRRMEEECERKPRELDAHRRELEAQEAKARDAHDIVVAARKRIDQRTVESDALQQEIVKLEGQLFTLKSTTEFDAMKAQIAARKAKNDEIQDQVLELMMGIDDLLAAQEREEGVLAEEKARFERAKQAVDADLTRMQTKLEDARKKLDEAVGRLPDEVRSVYEAVKRRRGNAVCELRDEICTGCDTRVTFQTLNEVMSNRLTQCRNCERVLFVRR